MPKKPSNEHRMVEYSTQDQFEAEEADRLRIQAARDALAADDEAGAFFGERFEVGARCSPARTVFEVEQRDVHPARVRTSGCWPVPRRDQWRLR